MNAPLRPTHVGRAFIANWALFWQFPGATPLRPRLRLADDATGRGTLEYCSPDDASVARGDRARRARADPQPRRPDHVDRAPLRRLARGRRGRLSAWPRDPLDEGAVDVGRGPRPVAQDR